MDQVPMAFPPLESPSEEPSGGAGGVAHPGDDGPARLSLEQRLQALRLSHQQELQRTERHHRAQLEKRILQNSLLSSTSETRAWTGGPVDRKSVQNGSHSGTESGIHVAPRRSSPSPDLSSSTPQRQRPTGSSKAPEPRGSSVGYAQGDRALGPRQPCPSWAEREEAALAECQKQFRAKPVPEHVLKALYDDITQQCESNRMERHEQRRDFLLSLQKPFSFAPREERKREQQTKDRAAVHQKEKAKPAEMRQRPPRAVAGPRGSEHLREQEVSRRLRIQARAQETLRASAAPSLGRPAGEEQGGEGARSSIRSRSRTLAFLQQRPSFRPRTGAPVPDFQRLHRALQRQAGGAESDGTRCQPFRLRTAVARPRQSTVSTAEEMPAAPSDLRRGNSLTGLTSLSMDTLPTYTTDTARRRQLAIRRRVEEREFREQEEAEGMRRRAEGPQGMRRAVSTRARSMDPHRSLQEVRQQKLLQHRRAERYRVREYGRELTAMRMRVSACPFLFEQLSQRAARSDAERRYRSTLEKVGLDESFVRERGENAKETIPCADGGEAGHAGGESSSQSSIRESSGADEEEEEREEENGERVEPIED